MKRPHFAGLLIGTLFLGVTLTLAVQHVRAAGIPETNAFTYSGYLAGADGTPVNTPQAINLYVYNAAGGGNPLCQVAPGTPTSVVSGRFQIQLPPECTELVKQNADLWIEVHVGGIPLGRTKLGAVPYAVEAGHALKANNANTASSATVAATAASATVATQAIRADDASGALQTAISDIRNRINVIETAKVGDCLEYKGDCAGGIFNNPLHYIDRLSGRCPDERPLLRGIGHSRCGALAAANEPDGMQLIMYCCAPPKG